MKECCEWWNAALRMRDFHNIRAENAARDDWGKAVQGMLRSHSKAVKKKPGKPKSSSATTWHEATRRLWTQHLKRVDRSDAWAKAIGNLATSYALARKYVKAEVAEKVGKRRRCPECRKRKANRLSWVRKCLAKHKQKLRYSQLSGWYTALSNIATGQEHRVRKCDAGWVDRSRVRYEWNDGIKAAIQRSNGRDILRRRGEWESWATNAESNNRKRIRRKTQRKSHRPQPALPARLPRA